ncbi:hypothetical protein GCM10011575_46940 [Microlunatus endophyticus]|uniref:Methyltransferase domain-containing protein n=1 Tax=Microlunatus endophyticus TaxID=1716077 RepID=A0A917SK24_9ACTN|nr:class I SAM-dependent methyltransferase [Microlunatus endophyticus]GGL83217.1 hypothetical protein GCM10011575_46940 [Microlunatus endophyticus]
MSYSAHFANEHEAERYDTDQYAPSAYATLLWEIEQQQLDEVLGTMAPRQFDHLDFACGTGRVLQHVVPQAASSTAIDVSEAMAARARARVPSATVITRDITRGGEIEGSYDVVTAFRFILNAEPQLREAGLNALAARLRNSSSILIFNNHGHLLSHKALLAVPHWIRRRGARRQSGNLMTHRKVVVTARQSGLQVQRVAGCGVLGGRLAKMIPRSAAVRIERWAARSPLSWFGSNQLYVARRES